MINEGTGSLNITLEGMVSQHSGDLRYSKFLCGVCFFSSKDFSPSLPFYFPQAEAMASFFLSRLRC